MKYIKQPEEVKHLDWDNWDTLKWYIETHKVVHVPLCTHIDTLRYYIIKIIKEQNATINS